MPTPLRHQLHNEHHHCEFTASWDGRRCPHSRVTTVQELGAAPSPHRVPACLLGTSRKFALHTRAAAFQHDVGTQPGACCNTTGIPKESSPILQPELDKRGPFPSENARGRDREDSSSWCHRLEKDRGAKNWQRSSQWSRQGTASLQARETEAQSNSAAPSPASVPGEKTASPKKADSLLPHGQT